MKPAARSFRALQPLHTKKASFEAGLFTWAGAYLARHYLLLPVDYTHIQNISTRII